MKLNDKDHELLKREVRDKTNWSYTWAGISGVLGICTAAFAGAALGLPIFGMGFGESLAAAITTGLGAAGAGFQSYSYDREIAMLHERVENEIAKEADHEKELGGVVKQLAKEIHAMNEQTAPQRNDGLSWVQYVESQKAPARAPEPVPTPNPSA